MSRGGGVWITNAVNVGIALQASWENREFISNISINVRRLFGFLINFDGCTELLLIISWFNLKCFFLLQMPTNTALSVYY
ncbi:hypothetical protein MKW98_014023 [Papaver atlanticum]|uniref:Uncharacterized protein n=1 Tax=Papaver atlanticum TaxID=357466 RepID=A0AAD4SKA5_9MAGN|nr:hypothetical protein MKW98_014023 [Papaver atlanticum]